MGSYHIWHGVYHICPKCIYTKGQHVRLYRLMKRWLPLTYICLVCSCGLFLMIGRGRRDISTNFYTPLSWVWKWKNGSCNPWIRLFSTVFTGVWHVSFIIFLFHYSRFIEDKYALQKYTKEWVHLIILKIKYQMSGFTLLLCIDIWTI